MYPFFLKVYLICSCVVMWFHMSIPYLKCSQVWTISIFSGTERWNHQHQLDYFTLIAFVIFKAWTNWIFNTANSESPRTVAWRKFKWYCYASKLNLCRMNGFVTRISEMIFSKFQEIKAKNLPARQHSQFGLGGLN